MHLDNHTEWRNGYELRTGMNLTKERVVQRFQIYPGDPQKPGDPGVFVEPGTYSNQEVQLEFNTNRAARLSLESTMFAGGFFGGSRVSISPAVKLRKGDTFAAEVHWSRNDVHLPGGGFRTNLIRTRLSYSFTPRLFVQSLVQYNDRDNIWSMNFRFAWLQAANTGIFVVYDDSRDIFDARHVDRGLPDRSLTIKISHLFDLLN